MLQQATLLYVSDDPETFPSPGRLFHGPLPRDGTVARILFDHVNGTTVPMRLMVGIANTGTASASIGLSGGAGGPNANGMQAGHAATLRYLQARELAPNGGVTTHNIPPGGGYVVANAVLPVGQCFAGIYDVAAPAGSALELRVFACDPSQTSMSAFGALPEIPMTQLQRRGIYQIPGTAEQTLSYSGTILTFPVGAVTYPRAPADPTPGAGPLKGEYGVLRRITCTFAPGSGAAMYQTPRGGSATGTYYIGGKMLASHAVPAKTRSKIAVFGAGAGTVTLVTMAEINSSYPLDITVEPNDVALADPGTAGSFVYNA